MQGKQNPYTVMSYYQVAKVLGITPMRVCQLEHSALRKIRAEFIKRGIVRKP